MAQALLLKGVKDVVNYTSTDGTFSLRLKQNLRGGDIFQIKQWWNYNKRNTVYNPCTIFTIAGTNYELVIPTSSSTNLGIGYDGDPYAFTFTNMNEVDRAAVFKTDGTLCKEWLFPSISGGTIATRTLVAAETTIGTVEITGAATVDKLNVGKQYTATVTGGDADNLSYAWTSTPSTGVTFNVDDAEVAQVVFTQDGTYVLNCEVSDSGAGNSPQTADYTVTVSSVTIGTVSVSGPATALTGQTKTYTASITGDTDNPVYSWSVTSGNATIPAGSTASKAITFTGTGNEVVKCDVSSTHSSDTPQSGTTNVVVSTPIGFGTGSIAGSASIAADTATQYTISWTGDTLDTGTTYAWSVAPTANTTLTDDDAVTATFEASAAGTYTLTCIATNATVNDGSSPLTETKTVTVS